MLSKKQQTKSNRIKPTAIKEPKYLAYLHTQNLVCFSCGKQNKIELHHIKRYSSDLKNDTHTIPLCGEECHRTGTELSAHGTPKKFRELYPMEVQIGYANELYRAYNENI